MHVRVHARVYFCLACAYATRHSTPPTIVYTLCMCTHLPQSTPPTRQHGLLQVLGGCTEAVEGEVLHNCAGPLTSMGHHTKSPPLHLTDVNIYVIYAIKAKRSLKDICVYIYNKYIIYKYSILACMATVNLAFHGFIHIKTCIHMSMSTQTHTHVYT